MIEICGYNVPDVYTEAIQKMNVCGHEESSRNGPVKTIPEPVLLRILNPMERVLFDPIRNANPFFHVMEWVWMAAGSRNLEWIQQFNSKFKDYSDDGVQLSAAYGWRWRNHFGIEQIQLVIDQLKKDRTTRRAVIGMWSPSDDLSDDPLAGKDRPCNLVVMFRVQGQSLDMTVINRSNDLIWGMLGANAVHMTFLHELISRGAGLVIGEYKVFTNNLHVYTSLPNYEQIMKTLAPVDLYGKECGAAQLLYKGETVQDFLDDALLFVGNSTSTMRTEWFKNVAAPIYLSYMERKIGAGDGLHYVNEISATDWRLACRQWIERKQSSLTSMGPSQTTTTEPTT